MDATNRRGARRLGDPAFFGILATAVIASGCISTPWKVRSVQPQTATTVLMATSHPPATVFIDGEDRGSTPLEFPLHYASVRREQTRDVTLWKSNPKLATALTVLTGGVYLPSSLFPISRQSKTEKTGFRENAFHVRIEAEGYEPFDSMIVLQGEREERIDVDLQPFRGATERSGSPENEDGR